MPSAFEVQISGCRPGSCWNAIRAPSGDQAGYSSSPLKDVIRVWALPSAPIVKMLLSVGNPLRGLENASFPLAPGNAARAVAGDAECGRQCDQHQRSPCQRHRSQNENPAAYLTVKWAGSFRLGSSFVPGPPGPM